MAAQLAHSERMRGFLLRSLVSVDDATREERVGALEALATRLDAELVDDALAQGELRVAIGEAMIAQGERARGEALVAHGRAQLRAQGR